MVKREIDFAFVRDLLQVFPHPEGSMFSAGSTSNINILDRELSRIDVICESLINLNPKNILEMGTHKAEFCYLAKLYLPNCSITTICELEQSRICVDMVNDYFGEDFITFICDKSPDCWSRINLDSNFDFGYVDGGHDVEPCYADLVNFAKLKIPFFMIDDIGMSTVWSCIEKFFDEEWIKHSSMGYRRGKIFREAGIIEMIRL